MLIVVMGFKGLQLPNPAPDIYADLDPPQEETPTNPQPAANAAYLRGGPNSGKLIGSMQDFAGPSPLDAPQKKRYPKEAWSGKKLNSIGGLF